MTENFRKQTTELQTIFPFKGKGLVNDRLRLDINGAEDGQALVFNGTSGKVEWAAVASEGGDNIYTTDGTLTESRTVSLGSNNLTFNSEQGGNFDILLSNEVGEILEVSFREDRITIFGEAPIGEEGPGTVTTTGSLLRTNEGSDLRSLSQDFDYGDDDNFITLSENLGTDDNRYQLQWISEGSNASTTNFEHVLDFYRQDGDSNGIGYAYQQLRINSDGGSYALQIGSNDNNRELELELDHDNGGAELIARDFENNTSAYLFVPSQPGDESLELTSLDGNSSAFTSILSRPGVLYLSGSGGSDYEGSAFAGFDSTDPGYFIVEGNGFDSKQFTVTGDGTDPQVCIIAPARTTLYNYDIIVRVFCTDAGNGIGAVQDEALVGWYGIGVNNISGTPVIVGTGQALAPLQADTSVADATITFDIDSGALRVIFTPPSTAGTTTTYFAEAAVRALGPSLD